MLAEAQALHTRALDKDRSVVDMASACQEAKTYSTSSLQSSYFSKQALWRIWPPAASAQREIPRMLHEAARQAKGSNVGNASRMGQESAPEDFLDAIREFERVTLSKERDAVSFRMCMNICETAGANRRKKETFLALLKQAGVSV